ncbi:MAG: DUF2878 family protein [Parachlamydiaceae bacterium]
MHYLKLRINNTTRFNTICYCFGWCWSVLLGSNNHTWMAVFGVIILIALQLYLLRKKSLESYLSDTVICLLSVPSGLLLEEFLMQTQLVNYPTATFPPLWVLILYPLFALIINHSLSWLHNRKGLAFLFAFSLAPLSYIAGAKLGGLQLGHTFWLSYMGIGWLWGFYCAFMVYMANEARLAALATLVNSVSKQSIELLYDQDCPICSKEICYLKKKNPNSHIRFVNIASPDYKAEKHQQIDYQTAMQQIHAIDSQGYPITGLPAFTLVYAKSHLYLLATFLFMPSVQRVLSPFYDLFAKHRLWLTGRNQNKH